MHKVKIEISPILKLELRVNDQLIAPIERIMEKQTVVVDIESPEEIEAKGEDLDSIAKKIAYPREDKII